MHKYLVTETGQSLHEMHLLNYKIMIYCLVFLQERKHYLSTIYLSLNKKEFIIFQNSLFNWILRQIFLNRNWVEKNYFTVKIQVYIDDNDEIFSFYTFRFIDVISFNSKKKAIFSYLHIFFE